MNVKVSLLPSHRRLGDRGSIFLDDYISKDGSRVFEEDILGLLKGQESGRRFTSQKVRETIYNCVFSKVSAVRKGRSEAYSLGKARLKFSQAEENPKHFPHSFPFQLHLQDLQPTEGHCEVSGSY